MQPTKFPLRRISPRGAAVLLGFLLLLSVASVSQAQSGRHPPKQPKSPDPFPSKQEDPPIAPPSDQKSIPKIPVKVVWDLYAIASSSIYSRDVLAACLGELSRSGSIAASATAKEQNRKQAIDMAKASTDTYVVWFQLEPDPAYNDRSGIGSIPPQYLIVSFYVFTPTTGKTKTSGRVYQRSVGPGGLPVPGTGTNGYYSLEYAGREMADRVLDALGLGRPPH
jgi:hypothetical protein